VTFGDGSHAELAGGVLALRPAADRAGTIVWHCGATSPADHARRGSDLFPAASVVETTVPDRYLPAECRGRSDAM
jgi:hypothetical protein